MFKQSTTKSRLVQFSGAGTLLHILGKGQGQVTELVKLLHVVLLDEDLEPRQKLGLAHQVLDQDGVERRLDVLEVAESLVVLDGRLEEGELVIRHRLLQETNVLLGHLFGIGHSNFGLRR